MAAFALPDNLEEVQFLELDDVDFFHESILDDGQLRGYKQKSDLEGALGRPKNAACYDPRADLALLASYYWHGISTSHGYVDGNKRTGFISMTNFLLMNGLHFLGNDKAAGRWVENLFMQDRFELEILDRVVRGNTVPMTESGHRGWRTRLGI